MGKHGRARIDSSPVAEPREAKRTISGERRIALVPDGERDTTRQSEKFRVPREALRSSPPPSETAHVKATTQMAVPEGVRQLALPTPAREVDLSRVAETVKLRRRATRATEIVNALGMVVVIVAVTAWSSYAVVLLLFR